VHQRDFRAPCITLGAGRFCIASPFLQEVQYEIQFCQLDGPECFRDDE
jgi:hypothetical protein